MRHARLQHAVEEGRHHQVDRVRVHDEAVRDEEEEERDVERRHRHGVAARQGQSEDDQVDESVEHDGQDDAERGDPAGEPAGAPFAHDSHQVCVDVADLCGERERGQHQGGLRGQEQGVADG